MAIEYAVQLFEDTTCEFYLLHVVKTSKYITGSLMAAPATSTVFDSVVKKAKDDLIARANQLKDRENKLHRFTAVTDYDNFIDAVNQLVKKENIELVVMGTNGQTGAKEKIFGSNTVQVFRNVDIPVLAIPEGCGFTGLQRALLVLENVRYGAKLEQLEVLSKILKTEITVVDLLPKKEQPVQNQYLDRVTKAFPLADIKMSGTIAANGEAEVHNALASSPFDMIIVIGEKKPLIQRLLKGSIAKNLVYNSKSPLLLA